MSTRKARSTNHKQRRSFLGAMWDAVVGKTSRLPQRRRLSVGIEMLETRTVMAASLVGDVNWLAVGPRPIINGQAEGIDSTGPGADPVNGAIHSLALHPTNASIAYLGTVDGGVWKTTDFTATNPVYTPLTDQFPGTAIGALAFDPTDATYNTLVAGIGQFNSFTSSVGVQTTQLTGILRTTDGGASWNQLGVSTLTGVNISGIAAAGNTILVSGNTISAGTNSGVYISIDGGGTFNLLSGTNGLGVGPATDLVVDPTNSNRVYVGIQGVGIFRNDNFGTGAWSNVSSGTAALNTQITSAGNNNIEMAISPQTGRIFAGVIVNGRLRFMGSSANQGGAWTEMDLPVTNDTEGIFTTNPSTDKPGGQGAIHFSITVDPTNENLVYVGGDRQPGNSPNGANSLGALDFSGRLFRGNAAVAAANPGNTTIVGSAQWASLTHTQNAVFAGGGTADNSAPHADSREMAFRADGTLIEVDDGGIYARSNPSNNTGVWSSRLSNGAGGLQVANIHDIAYDSVSNIIVAGFQDTGTAYQTSPGSTTWTQVPFTPNIPNGTFGPIDFATGDGGDVAVDNLVGGGQSVRYFSFPNLGLFTRQVYDATGSLVSQAQPTLTGLPAGGRQFVTPIAVNEVAGDRLIVGLTTGVHESTNRGDNFSPVGAGIGVNRNAISYGASFNGVPNPNALFVGSGSAVFGRVAAGNLSATGALPAGASTIRDVQMNPENFNTVVAIDNNQVFISNNAGGSWTDITGGLADANLQSIVYIPNSGPGGDAILVGGAGGVFRMFTNQPGVWREFGAGLPNSVVYDTSYSRADDVLVVGTLGRGAFSVPNISSVVFGADGRSLIVEGDNDFAGQNDVIRIVRDSVNPNFISLYINGKQSGPYQLDLLDSIVVRGLGGNDQFIVDSTNGLINTLNGISFDGGDGFDRLDLTQTGGTTRTNSRVNLGANPGDGQSIIDTQVINFQNLEPITDNVPAASFNVSSVAGIASLLDAANAINYSAGVIGGNTWGRVTVDNFEPVEFQNKTALVIDAGAGSDEINLNNPNTPAGLTGITVNGGDPAGSDSLVINGTNGNNAFNYTTGGTVGSGSVAINGLPTVNFTTTESLVIDGQGGTDSLTLTNTTGHRVTYTPGSAADSGTMTSVGLGAGTAAVPLTFSHIGALATVTIAGTGDLLEVNGTNNSDTFNFTGTTVQILNSVSGFVTPRIQATNVSRLDLRGLDGDDTFNGTGTLAAYLIGVGIDGGNPSASDVVNLTGATGAVGVTLGATTTVSGYGSTVSLLGVEVLNANATAQDATLTGTGGDDVIDITPTGTDAVTAFLASSSPAVSGTPKVNFSNVGTTMNVDGAGGTNSLTFNGTAASDLISLSRISGALSLQLLGTQAINTSNTFSSWNVKGGDGNDSFNINETGGGGIINVIELNLDGGSGTNFMTLGTSFVHTYVPAGGNNGSLIGGAAVNFTNVANATTTFIGGNGAIVNAGAGANQITVNGTGASTVQLTVDNGTLMTFAGTLDTVIVNAGAGDDVISVTPGTFTGAGGITVDGGDPTASDTLLVVGTGGVDTVVFTPNFLISSGSLTGLSTPINFTTTEHVVYDGNDLAAFDNITINGTLTSDTFTYDAVSLKGSFRSFASPDFDTLRSARISVNGGGGGVDVVNLLGSAGVDTVTSAANAITIFTPGSGSIITLGAGIDAVTINTLGGDDNVNLSGVLAPITTTIFGGDGNDTIVGSPQVDSIYGGNGNDIIIGGAGNDFEYGEEGNDTFGNATLVPNGLADDAGADFTFGGEGFDNFVWEPGDGADQNNGGGDAADVFRFFGDANANVFTLRQGGTPTHFNALIGALVIDNHGIEDVIVDGQGGADSFTVEDLFATEVISVNLNLGAADAAAVDPVVVNGRNVADNIQLSTPSAGTINIQGLRYNVNLTNAEATDTLTVNGNEGDDTIAAAANLGGVILLRLSGNDGNDFLQGASGNDEFDGGAGDDTFFGGGGTDNVGGGAGSSVGDTVLAAGTSGVDTINLSLSPTGQLIATVNGLTTTYNNFVGGPIATSGIEQILVKGLAGNDSLTVDSTNGAIPVLINFDGGDNADLLTLTGGIATSDTYSVGPGVGEGTSTIVIGGVTQVVRFNALEPVVDLIAGPLVINATNANNAINYTGDTYDIQNGPTIPTGLVSIDGFETIEFASKTILTLNGLAGDDIINLNNAANAVGVTTINVNGGDPTASDTLIINGTAGNNTINYTTSSTIGSGTVAITGSATVNFTTTESLVIDGQGGTDSLTLTNTTPHRVTYTPGSAADSGTMTSVGLGAGTAAVPLTFSHIGATALVTIAGTGDFLEVNGTNNSDTFNFTGTTVQILNSVFGFVTPLIQTTNVASLDLRGLDGDDTFNGTGTLAAYVVGVTIDGGNPSASDVVNLTGATGAVGVTLDATSTVSGYGSTVSLLGVEVLNANATAQDATLTGTVGDDVIDITPTGTDAVTAFLVSSSPAVSGTPKVNFSNVGTTMTVDGGTGINAVTVNGTSTSDLVAINRDPANSTVQVNALQTVTVVSTAIKYLVVTGGLGSDLFDVTGGFGATDSRLTVDGGTPTAPGALNSGDRLNVTTGNNVAVDVSYGTDPTSGVVQDTVSGNVNFLGIDHLGLTGTGANTSLTVEGTNGNDAINQNGNVVTVNNGAPVTFASYPTLTLNGNNGDDKINVRSTTLVGVTTVNVSGGEPAASGDTLVVIGGTSFGYNPLDIGSGNITVDAAPVVNFTTIESAHIDGDGGNDGINFTTIAGTSELTYTPGTDADTGTITTREGARVFVPLTFSHISSFGSVNFFSAGGREDTLEFDGTLAGDFFTVNSLGEIIVRDVTATSVTELVRTAGISELYLRGFAGDDSFNVNGPLPYTNVFIDAGEPSASDVVNLTGATGAVGVTLSATTTVTGYGSTISLLGVEVLNADASTQNVTVTGSSGNDAVDVRPTSATAATITRVSSTPAISGSPVINASNIGTTFTVDLAGGTSDTLNVYGTAAAQTITANVSAATGTVAITGGLITTSFPTANTESLRIFALEGSDTIDVTPGTTTAIFVDGGDPIGITGDTIIINGGVTLFKPGPENDEGGFQVAANQIVSFDHIEAAIVVGAPCAIVTGTNADDDITVIARDASYNVLADGVQDFTVSVNNGLDVLYVGTSQLGIDAMSGDDDIVIRAPAPNDAAWNVAVSVVGGSPSIGDPNKADRLVLETPFTDAITFTPNGPDTATLSINAGAGGVINMLSVLPAGFCPGIVYNSSVGGIEVVQYDGELAGANGATGAVADTITIAGTAGDDTTTINASGIGSGTFRSSLSPLFDFRSFTTVTVDGGAGGFDRVNINGTEGTDIFTSPAVNAVQLTGGVRVNLGSGVTTTVDQVALFAYGNPEGAGNEDNITLSLTSATLSKWIDGGAGPDIINLSGSVDATIYGGDGNDNIIGTPAADDIFGGSGNDTITAGAGSDNVYGEADSDTLIWNNGDNTDLMEGGTGTDIVRVNGATAAAAGEQFRIQANGARVQFDRLNLVAFTLDIAQVEQLDLNTDSSNDNAEQITVNSLLGTDLKVVNIDAGVDGNNTLTLNASVGADVISVGAFPTDPSREQYLGLGPVINTFTFNSADRVTINGLEGNDSISIDSSIMTSAPLFTLNGGSGNDTLTGGSAVDTLTGGTGDDILIGNGGLDNIDGGDGEDTIFVDFDGVTDVITGGNDYDTVVILGTSANNILSAFQSAATTLISTRQTPPAAVVSDTDTINTIESVRIEAGAGNDTIYVKHAEVLENTAGSSVLFVVDGGPGTTGDRLVVQDDGGADLMLQRKSDTGSEGSVTIGPVNTEPLNTEYQNIEYVNLIPVANDVTDNNIVVFKYDPFELNNTRLNATHLGVGETLNVDPVIDPGVITTNVPANFINPVPEDVDWYRVQALRTGTMDIRLFFRQLATLPGNGDLDLRVTDSAGNTIQTDADTDDNARVRIPVVEGEIYYIRVFGKTSTAINTYSISVVNDPAPAPFELELDDTLFVGSDTGRSRFDNVTFDNTPTIFLRLDDHALLNDVPNNGAAPPTTPFDGLVIPVPFVNQTATNSTASGFRVAIFDTENNTHNPVPLGYAQPVGGRPGVYTFTFNTALADGSHFINARVEMIDGATPEQAQGFGAFSSQVFEIIVDTVQPPVFFGNGPLFGTDGLHADSDSGYTAQNGLLVDRITNDLTPTMWGIAEANAYISLFVDLNDDGDIDPTDIYLGSTTAAPIDGGDQFPDGYWEITSAISMNDPAIVNALIANGVIPAAGQVDGRRPLLVTGEDLAGNERLNNNTNLDSLDIFVDTQGPQVNGVFVTNFNGYDLFDPKPTTDGPTPLVFGLDVDFIDPPIRVDPAPVGGADRFVYPAVNQILATNPGNYRLVGDHNGIIPLSAANFNFIDTTNAGTIGTTRVQLVFPNPLPDDRYTLTISDRIGDDATNKLDGSANTPEPQEDPFFPSGDGVPGGDFVARFTIDSRPEIGVFATGNVWVDTNQNETFDPENPDFVNRDIIYQMGLVTDDHFAGNFVQSRDGVADRFDKLAAYGRSGANFRFIVDTNNDGVPDITGDSATNPNGKPISGNFDRAYVNSDINGDEVGVFTGTQWYFDTDHDFIVGDAGGSFTLTSALRGLPITGDFDGDGNPDLGTFLNDTFYFDLSSMGGTLNANLPGLDGAIDRQFYWGLVGTRDVPVAADMNQDGFTDIGLYQPDTTGQAPKEGSEWFWLISGNVRNNDAGPATIGPAIVDRPGDGDRIIFDPATNRNVVRFTTQPFGNDQHMFYGDEFSDPIVGNFDPPVTSPNVQTNLGNPYDANIDGLINIQDVLKVVYSFNRASEANYYDRLTDINRDGKIDVSDILQIVYAYGRANPEGAPEGESSAASSTTSHAQAVDAVFAGDLFANDEILPPNDDPFNG